MPETALSGLTYKLDRFCHPAENLTAAKPNRVKRPRRIRSIRARRTAAIMVVFGIALGCVELAIVLSYL